MSLIQVTRGLKRRHQSRKHLSQAEKRCDWKRGPEAIARLQAGKRHKPLARLLGEDEEGHARGKSRCDQFSAVINLVL